MLGERFGCPALPMDELADAVLGMDFDRFEPDTSDWPQRLKPFMVPAVEDELTKILTSIARG